MDINELREHKVACYERINGSYSIRELKDNIHYIGDIITSKGERYSAEFHCKQIDIIVDYYKAGNDIKILPFNLVSRKYGVRQQLMYILITYKI